MNNIPTEEIASLLRRLADTLSPLPAPKKPDPPSPPSPPKTPLQQARELLECVPEKKLDAGLAMYRAGLSRASVRHALQLTFEEAQAMEVVSRAPVSKSLGRPLSLDARWRRCFELFSAGKTNDEVEALTGTKGSTVRAYRHWWKRDPTALPPKKAKG